MNDSICIDLAKLRAFLHEYNRTSDQFAKTLYGILNSYFPQSEYKLNKFLKSDIRTHISGFIIKIHRFWIFKLFGMTMLNSSDPLRILIPQGIGGK